MQAEALSGLLLYCLVFAAADPIANEQPTTPAQAPPAPVRGIYEESLQQEKIDLWLPRAIWFWPTYKMGPDRRGRCAPIPRVVTPVASNYSAPHRGRPTWCR